RLGLKFRSKHRPWRLSSVIAENTDKTDRPKQPQKTVRQPSSYMNLGEVAGEQYSRSHFVQELPVFDQRHTEIQEQRHLPECYPGESVISSGTRPEAVKDHRGRADSYLSRVIDPVQTRAQEELSQRTHDNQEYSESGLRMTYSSLTKCPSNKDVDRQKVQLPHITESERDVHCVFCNLSDFTHFVRISSLIFVPFKPHPHLL
ncbi:hypothetical protein P879_08474, partial [Paragonimus westermani]